MCNTPNRGCKASARIQRPRSYHRIAETRFRTVIMQSQNHQHGISLLEMMIAMALGVMVMASMVRLFKAGVASCTLVIQRTEMQQNMRAAIELMSKDISLAGSGLPSGGIQLPTNGTVSRYGCDPTMCYVPNGTYPNNNYLTGVLPGYNNGVEAQAT